MATQDSQGLQAAPRTQDLNARHAAKLAHRQAHPEKTQTYAANRGAGAIADISDADARHQAKLEARIAAFNAGRKPDAAGHLDVDLSKGDAGKAAPAETKPKGEKAKEESKGHAGKA